MKRLTPEHPKTLALMERLGCSRIIAVGILELLWHFTARYSPQGNVGKWSDRAIADGIGWEGPADALVAALVGAGWLDEDPEHRLLIHDWKDHADEAVKKALGRAGLSILSPASSEPGRDVVSTPSRPERDSARLDDVETPSRPPVPCLALPEPVPEPCQSQSPSGAREAELPAYLEALRRLHPAFADELAVGRALFETRQLLPPLAEFEATLAAWASSERWTDEGGRFAPKPARWVRDGGFKSLPPPPKRTSRSGAAIPSNRVPTTSEEDPHVRRVHVG